MRNEALFKEKPVWSAILMPAIPSVAAAQGDLSKTGCVDRFSWGCFYRDLLSRPQGLDPSIPAG